MISPASSRSAKKRQSTLSSSDPRHRWSAAWLDGDRLVALLSVNTPRDMLQGRRVISSGVPVDPARLADPQIPVRDCVLT